MWYGGGGGGGGTFLYRARVEWHRVDPVGLNLVGGVGLGTSHLGNFVDPNQVKQSLKLAILCIQPKPLDIISCFNVKLLFITSL